MCCCCCFFDIILMNNIILVLTNSNLLCCLSEGTGWVAEPVSHLVGCWDAHSMPVDFCSCCWTNPCNNLHKLSSHIRGISVWFVEQIMCFPYTLVQKRLCSLSAQMQSANWSHPALNSLLHSSWIMPKYNIFKYNELVIVIVIATIATVEGLMCWSVISRSTLMLRVSSFEPDTLGMSLNTITI